MTTLSIAAYGIQLRLGDGVASGPANITAATNATPIVLTTGVPHGIVDVGTVTVSGVLGNTAANGTWIGERVSTNVIKLRGTVGNGAFTSGGNLIRTDTFAVIAEVTNLVDVGIQATLVECSAHDGNNWTSRKPTLLSGNTVRLSLNFVPTTPTHNPTTGLEYLLLSKIRRGFLVVFPDVLKTTWWFSGWVVGHRVAGPVAGILTAETTIEMIDAPILAAAA